MSPDNNKIREMKKKIEEAKDLALYEYIKWHNFSLRTHFFRTFSFSLSLTAVSCTRFALCAACECGTVSDCRCFVVS